MELPTSFKPWSPHMKCTGINATQRVKDILDLVASTRLRDMGYRLFDADKLDFSTKRDILQHTYADISQNPRYRSFTNSSGVTGCLSTATTLYSFGQDRIVLGKELSMIQGHRRGFSFPDEMKSSQIRDLSGEGMFVPCLGTVLWAMYLTKGLP